MSHTKRNKALIHVALLLVILYTLSTLFYFDIITLGPEGDMPYYNRTGTILGTRGEYIKTLMFAGTILATFMGVLLIALADCIDKLRENEKK